MIATDQTEVNDLELITRSQRGDEAGIVALYDRYYVRIYRFALVRVGNSADAEDLAQETFLKMVDKLVTFRWYGVPFSAWLFRIAHNTVVDFLRHKSSKEVPLPLEDFLVDAKEDPAARVEQILSREELMRAIRRLTPAQQEVLALRFGGGLSVNETAKTLGKAEGTVKATQFQAFQILRRMLTEIRV